MKNNEIIQRLKKCYVGEDCCQTMFPFGKKATIISPDGILFHIANNDITNSYSDDERRKQFPYNNIPIHYQGYIPYFNTNMGYSNQVVEYNKPYIEVTGGCVFETVALKDDDTALIISKFLYPLDELADRVTMRGEEILENLKPKKGEKVYYIYEDGEIDNDMPLEEKDNDTTIFVIRANNNDIKSKGYKFIHQYDDFYYVDRYNIPVSNYTLEQLKEAHAKIKNSCEPDISLKLNPDITKDDLKQAKRMVKSLKKY